MDFCENQSDSFVACVKLTPSLAPLSSTLLGSSTDLKVHSVIEARRKIGSSVHLELAALPYVRKMASEDLNTVAQLILHHSTSIFPSTSRTLAEQTLLRNWSLACISMTVSLLSFIISFTLFKRQWQCLNKHP